VSGSSVQVLCYKTWRTKFILKYPNFEEYIECQNHDSGYGWFTITPIFVGLFIYVYKKLTGKKLVRIIWYKL